MRVAIHQPNYFPWMGYFNKIAKSDLFLLLDSVQLSDSGTGQRNRLLNKNGDISFITVSFNKKDYLNKKIFEIELNQNVDWQKRQYNFLWDTYHKFPFWNEVFQVISPIYQEKFYYLYDVNKNAIEIVCRLLEIKTPLIRTSALEYNKICSKSDLVLELCRSVGADTYLSGNGAKKYMKLDDFLKNGINVQYQTFSHPLYYQKYSKNETVVGLSILDVLFNCGINKTKEIFWSNLQNYEVNAIND